jgi:hypothetical protein
MNLYFVCGIIILAVIFSSSLITNVQQWRINVGLREQVSWLETRFDDSHTSNWYMFHKLEKQVSLLNRRIINLIESPKTYLRARRIVGTLELPVDEIIAEIELMNELEELEELAAEVGVNA